MENQSPQFGEKLSRLSMTSMDEEPITVLIVEDSKTVRTQLRQYLGLLDNVTVLEAGSLKEARLILEASSHALFGAILDLTLPDASGLEVVDAVRAYQVPIIVLTGSADVFLRQAVLDMRVIDYMFKNGSAAIEDVAYLIGRLRQNQSMKVLVVDDSQTSILHVSGLLAQYRYQILTAKTGREALAQLAQHPDIALVLTDYHMPEMNGLELVQQIRRKYRREDLAIIALSDISRPELSAAMLKAGANDYLNKKFQAEEFYCRVVQNTNMVRYVHELHDMANRDYLTRLHNRRYLFRAAEALYAEARAGKRDIAVAMIDADNFKQINDGYGHAVGDEALIRIAGVLRRGLARSGIVTRFGGEEFVAVITIGDPTWAKACFEKIRQGIEAIQLEVSGQVVPITVSIGVTTALGGEFSDMIELADQAVYRAKQAGRNQVVELSPVNVDLHEKDH